LEEIERRPKKRLVQQGAPVKYTHILLDCVNPLSPQAKKLTLFAKLIVT